MKKSKNHIQVITNFKEMKNKRLEVLANRALEKDENNQKLKNKIINPNFLKHF